MSSTAPGPIDVLLIEDDSHAADLFLERTRHFAPGEFNVTQARSLEAGLAEAADIDFNLAVLDLTLPDSTGIQTCSRFSAAQPNVPFIVLTGVTDGSLVQTISRAGAKAALIKDDCDAIDLVRAIRSSAEKPGNERVRLPEVTRAVAEARFRNAIIDSADGIVVIDTAGGIQLVSAGAESLLGLSTAELIGTPLGIDLNPGEPVRAQVTRERRGHAETHNGSGEVRQFDVCHLHISEIEFWPFEHYWSGKQVTVCAMRDISNQSAEEHRQRNIVRIEQPLQIAQGMDVVCADLAVRLGALVKFNRFEASVWREDLQRLQVMVELGSSLKGRGVSSLVNRETSPIEFASWTTEWSNEDTLPRVAISLGCAEADAYSGRDRAILVRCADLVAGALARSTMAPVFSTGEGAEIPNTGWSSLSEAA